MLVETAFKTVIFYLFMSIASIESIFFSCSYSCLHDFYTFLSFSIKLWKHYLLNFVSNLPLKVLPTTSNIFLYSSQQFSSFGENVFALGEEISFNFGPSFKSFNSVPVFSTTVEENFEFGPSYMPLIKSLLTHSVPILFTKVG